MSISAVSGSGGFFDMAEMMQQARKGQSPDTDEMAQFMVKNDDQDGDGLLSLSETKFDEDMFKEIDGDGDGYLTTEELSADAQSRMESGSFAPPSMDGMQGASGASGSGSSDSASSSSSSSDSDDEEEEYDQYDLNKDGVVSADELLQAYQKGDLSLSDLFGKTDGSSSLNQRLGMQAYEAQMAAV